MQGDPLADAVIESMSGLTPEVGRGMIERALVNGTESVSGMPPALGRLVRQTHTVPDWLDWDLLDLGGATFLRTGPFGFLALVCYALPLAYASPDANKPLALSGHLVDRAPRRLAETGQFVLEVCRPGGLRRGGAGFAACLKVRLMHARVRRSLQSSPKWNLAEWGVPINQADMAGTSVVLSVLALDALQYLGFHFTAREREAVVHLWRYVGYLMGVEPELLSHSETEARHLAEAIGMSVRPPDEDSRQLTHALLDARLLGATPVPGFSGFYHTLARLLLGDQLADSLHLPRKRAHSLAVPLLRRAIPAAELARRMIPGLHTLAVVSGVRLWDSALSFGLAGMPAEFHTAAGCPVH
ncbi:MAG: DUF2236 domain-containing protein [Chloroflexi bacterium]|nr:DUF2236 domain-containing protein [Chloroflexota bacterium]